METRISSNKTIAKNTLFLYGRMLFNLVVSLYTSRVILQMLGVNDYGVYQVVAGIVSLFTFVTGSLAGATSRFLTFELGRGDENILARTFAATLNVHIVTAGVFFLICETAGLWFVNYKLNIPADRMMAANIVFQCSILMTMLSLLQSPYNASIIAHEKMLVFAYVGILDTVLKLVACYLLFISSFDRLQTYGVVLLLFTLIINLIYHFYCKRFFKECRFKWSKDWSIAKPILVFSGWQLFGDFSLVAKNQGVNIILNLFFTVAVNAACGFANTIYGAIVGFANNFMMSIRPSIVKAYSINDFERMASLINVSCKFSFCLISLLSAPFLFDGQYILELWLKTPPDHSVIFSQLSLLTLLVVVLTSPVTYAIVATGNNKRLSLYGGVSMLLVLPISYVLLRLGFPPYVPFLVTLVEQLLVSGIYIRLLKKYVPLFSIASFYRTTVVPCVLMFLLVVGLTYLILTYAVYFSGLLHLLVVCAITTLLILSMTFFIVLAKSERIVVLSKFHLDKYFR